MNARTQTFELSLENNQVEEAIMCIFHSILFHRTAGKFNYKDEKSYMVGTVGMVDEDCSQLDFTYVRCDGDDLDKQLLENVKQFKNELCISGFGQISLEFFERRRKGWFFTMESIPWEIWSLRIRLVTVATASEREILTEKVKDSLTEIIIYIAETMNKPDFVPKVSKQAELGNIYDVSFKAVQPYLYKISSQTGDASNFSVGDTVKRFLREFSAT